MNYILVFLAVAALFLAIAVANPDWLVWTAAIIIRNGAHP